MVHSMWILLTDNLKTAFSQNWKFSGCNFFTSETTCWLYSEIFWGCGAYITWIHHCIFLIDYYCNWRKNVIFFVTMTDIILNRHSGWIIIFSFRQNHNIKLIKSPTFKSNQILFLEIKYRKRSFPHWLPRTLKEAAHQKCS